MGSNGVTVSPTAPVGTNGVTWLNSITKTLYFYASGWKSLNVKKLYIVRSTAELPIPANVNDGAIVLTTTSLVKYLYDGTSWQAIPQSIPFTYNGVF